MTVHEIVTEQIIESLEKGVVPWKRGWDKVPVQIPIRGSCGKPYRGINILLLMGAAWKHRYKSPYWFSYRQAAAIGAQVRRGEKGSLAVFWKPDYVIPESAEPDAEAADDKEDRPEGRRTRLVIRYYKVFNGDQIDGLPERFQPSPVTPPAQDLQFIPEIDAVVKGYLTRENVGYSEYGNDASYSLTKDEIVMPERGKFHSVSAFYGTLWHEVVHSTGAPKRLGRFKEPLGQYMGESSRSYEELVAELGSCFALAEYGMSSDIPNSAAYIDGWLQCLKSEKRWLVRAASAASRAVDFVHQRCVADDETHITE